MFVQRTLKGLMIALFILVGIFLVSNLDKGMVTTAPDRLFVYTMPGYEWKDVVKQVPNTTVLDEKNRIVGVPEGQTDEYMLTFKRIRAVAQERNVPTDPSISLHLYFMELKKQLQQYLKGDMGTLKYKAAFDPFHKYTINNQLPKMIGRSLAYLIPGVLFGIVVGYMLALVAVWKPRAGKVMDAVHAFLLGIPDFFLVILIQMLAIQLAKSAGHTVILIMQFGDHVPFLIPFLAISLLPSALIYGALRIAVAREWEEGYIKTAYAKGLSRTMVILVHILRNTMEDLLTILPRAFSTGISSLVVAEVMTGIFGLGGYAINQDILSVTTLPVTCAILAVFAMLAHLAVDLLRKKTTVQTKEGAQ
jgi:oligopeptide transport system permease protein